MRFQNNDTENRQGIGQTRCGRVLEIIDLYL